MHFESLIPLVQKDADYLKEVFAGSDHSLCAFGPAKVMEGCWKIKPWTFSRVLEE